MSFLQNGGSVQGETWMSEYTFCECHILSVSFGSCHVAGVSSCRWHALLLRLLMMIFVDTLHVFEIIFCVDVLDRVVCALLCHLLATIDAPLRRSPA